MAGSLPHDVSPQDVLEDLPAPVVILDAGERVLWSNAAARMLFEGCPAATPLARLDPTAAAVPLPGSSRKLARFPGDSAACALEVEEQAVLSDLVARLSGIEHRIREALAEP